MSDEGEDDVDLSGVLGSLLVLQDHADPLVQITSHYVVELFESEHLLEHLEDGLSEFGEGFFLLGLRLLAGDVEPLRVGHLADAQLDDGEDVVLEHSHVGLCSDEHETGEQLSHNHLDPQILHGHKIVTYLEDLLKDLLHLLSPQQFL